jgi:nitrite reductase (NO-forming)
MIAAIVCAALVVTSTVDVPQAWWTTIHLVTLGVLTNGIMQWSWYFARGILRLPPDYRGGARDAFIRAIAFNASLVALVAGMWAGVIPLVVAAATLVGAAVAWHGWALASASRTALGSRFRAVIRFYVAAAALFVAGCAVAGVLAVGTLDAHAPAWISDALDRWALAHSLLMVCGWLGLSIAGTLVTLGPTVLRTKMEDDAAPSAVRALPLLVAAVGVAAVSVLAGWTVVAGVSLAVYGVGLGAWIGLPLAKATARRGPREYAAWSMVAGVAWGGLGIAAFAVLIARAPDAAAAQQSAVQWIPVIGAASVAQIFVGALSYLLPVVVGGGPTPVRTGIATIETLATARLVVRNVALVALAVTIGVGSAARWAWWLLVILTFAADVVALAAAGARQAKARRAHREDAFEPLPPLGTRPPVTPTEES